MSATLAPERSEFVALVERDMRHEATEEEREALRVNPIRWYEELVEIKKKVDRLLGERAERLAVARQETKGGNGPGYAEMHREYEDWRRRTVGFKRVIEDKLAEVKPLRAESKDRTYVERLKVRINYLQGVIDRIEEIAVEGQCESCERIVDFLGEAVPEQTDLSKVSA